MFGSYYRVGFYGARFEELDGREFIYKEPKITKLVEVKERLVELYELRFGVGTVEVLSASKLVDRKQLDGSRLYIQLTSVEPHFDSKELKQRRTPYFRMNGLSAFIFDVPFTMTGDIHAASVAEQYKRKTILRVSHNFPYMTTRLPVVKKDEIELTPIENSTEAIEARTAAIKAESRSEAPNLKVLQPLIQGSLRLRPSPIAADRNQLKLIGFDWSRSQCRTDGDTARVLFEAERLQRAAFGATQKGVQALHEGPQRSVGRARDDHWTRIQVTARRVIAGLPRG